MRNSLRWKYMLILGKLQYQEQRKRCKAACTAKQDAGTMPKRCKKLCDVRMTDEVAANCPTTSTKTTTTTTTTTATTTTTITTTTTTTTTTITTKTVNGGWSSWGSCSKWCGSGIKTRECTHPQPAHGGSQCRGSSRQACHNRHCPVNGGGSGWGGCEGACMRGYRIRHCNNPRPQHGGSHCHGDNRKDEGGSCNRFFHCTNPLNWFG